MKVAILTLPLHTNYGGILQAYALQKTLEDMGHNVKVLAPERKKTHHIWVMPLVYCKRVIQKYIQKKDVSILYDGFQRPRQYTDKFIRNHINLKTIREWKELQGQFECYIVGSDQIWRPKYAKRFPGLTNAFLGFSEGWNVKRISYAASFGSDLWEYSDDETRNCSALVNNFDAVSVREKAGVDLCREKLSVEALHMPDPTMLLTAEQYMRLIGSNKRNRHLGEKKIVTYILDENDRAREYVKKMSEKFSLDIYRANSKVESPDAKPGERIQPPVEDWLHAIKNAEIVVTDSFHACVFSILFHKKFLVFINESRGNSRVISLLETFGLSDRIITEKEYNLRDIDYEKVEQTLSDQRESAGIFLKKNL